MENSSLSSLPPLLTLGNSLLRWHLRVDTLWVHAPTYTHERKCADGTRKFITRRGPRLVCDGAKTTGDILIKRARRQVERMLRSSLLYNVLVTDTGVQMPSVLVNARELNEQRSLTERTMRNHLAQLQKVGLITRKKWHGTNASFELWINPEFVWDNAQNGGEKQTAADFIAPTKAVELSPKSNKFPHTEAFHETSSQETLKVLVGDVHKYHADDFSGNPSQEAEGDNQAPGDAGQASKRGQGGRGATPAAPKASAQQDAATAARTAQNEAYVASAWGYAKALIYYNQLFSPEQEAKARQAIFSGVYGGFPTGYADWENYHAGVLRRIELVQEHYARRQYRGEKCYAPLPWAELIQGRGYFDRENTRGFSRTLSWLANDVRAKHNATVNIAVGKAYGELKLRRQLDRGEAPKRVGTRRKVPAHIESATLLELFRKHENSLIKLGGVEAVRKYHLKVNALLS